MCNVEPRRKYLWTCDQGEGPGGLDVPFQFQVTSSSVTPGPARPREDTQGHGPEPVPARGAGNVMGGS